MNKEIKKILSELENTEKGLEMLTGLQQKDNTVKSRGKKSREYDDEHISLNKAEGVNKIKLAVWVVALVLIVAQVFLLGWWTILTGILTIVIAYFVASLLSNATEILESIKESIREERTTYIVWILAVMLIVLQIFLLGWWTILTGIATIALAVFLPELIQNILQYFKS